MAGKTVEESKRAKLYNIIREVLGREYTELAVSKFTTIEDFNEKTSKISCSFSEASNENVEEKNITFIGRGLIDALFNALLVGFTTTSPQSDGTAVPPPRELSGYGTVRL